GTSPFAPNQPAYEEFPFTKWSRLWSRCWRRPAMDMLNYGDPLGYEPLRREIALYLADARGVCCEPTQVIIVSGAQKAIGLAAMVLLDPGDTVWMEDPGYVTMRELIRAYGARVAAVPVDQDGLDVKSGIAMAPAARMAVVTPSRQYPLGVLMSLPRRLELLEWAQTNRAWINDIEAQGRARVDGIVTNRMSYYYSDAPPRSGLHLGFCNTPPAEMSHQVQKLGKSLDTLTVAI
ncbi:MAG: PLP-dependent aminotransferase family protein, partial [Candidatus Tectomicrobia bacterium]